MKEKLWNNKSPFSTKIIKCLERCPFHWVSGTVLFYWEVLFIEIMKCLKRCPFHWVSGTVLFYWEVLFIEIMKCLERCPFHWVSGTVLFFWEVLFIKLSQRFSFSSSFTISATRATCLLIPRSRQFLLPDRHASNSLSIWKTRFLIIKYLTNYIVYETQRFNAAFTRALQ